LRPDVDLKTVFDGLSLPVLLIDRDCVITKANRAAGVPLQVPAASLVGRFCFAVTHGQKEPCWRQEAISCPAKEVFETGGQARSVHEHRWGEQVVVEEIVASPLAGADGEVSLVIAEFHKITERRQNKEELVRSQAQFEHYVEAVSHDLRSPLVSLLGFSQLFRKDYGARIDEEGRYFLDRIDQAGRTMESLIHDFLELSRIGRTEASKSLVDSRSVLADLYAELKPRLDQDGVSLELPKHPPLLMCNRTRLYQLFSNLVGNALDHMGSVERPTIRVEVKTLQDAHQITVSDNGKGIDPAYHDRIFEIFQSLGPRTDGRGGTGIGLAIVKKIVETHGGRVWVDSDLGRGAHFHLTLPCGKERGPLGLA
jgi:signal transduction histidine kinase